MCSLFVLDKLNNHAALVCGPEPAGGKRRAQPPCNGLAQTLKAIARIQGSQRAARRERLQQQWHGGRACQDVEQTKGLRRLESKFLKALFCSNKST